MTDSIRLSPFQELLIKSIPQIKRIKLRRYKFQEIFNAIPYVVKTGVQWKLLPPHFPKWQCVYHHFRSWSDRGWFQWIMEILVRGKRGSMGQDLYPSVGVIDSQSIRSALPHSVKGVDGHKKIKGIKRHICVDPNGYLIGCNVTTANIHDTRGISPVIGKISANIPSVRCLKGDKGYPDSLAALVSSVCSIELKSVKSNFGKSEFIPIDGRWVVERSFSLFGSYRRLNRNYEIKLSTAKAMLTVAAVAFMLRYF